MAELDLERHGTISHSELTTGRDVSHLLSHINHNFKQSKADQILRLLRDQDKLSTKSDDEIDLIREYDRIPEENQVCDSDTLTVSSCSVSDIEERLEPDIQQETVTGTMDNTNNHRGQVMNGHDNNFAPARETRSYRNSGSRTSMGFYDDGGGTDVAEVIDTRDISVRPKSSYVRRHQLKKCFEAESTSTAANNDMDAEMTERPPQRTVKSARPKSRLGRASVPRAERKIVMVEADTVVPAPEAKTPANEDVARATAGGANNMYDRFASTRQAKRDSKRESKRSKPFCDYDLVPKQTIENMSVGSSSNSMDIREDLTEVQPLATTTHEPNPVTSPVSHEQNMHTVNRTPSFSQNTVPRNSVQHSQQAQYTQNAQHAQYPQYVQHQQYASHHKRAAAPVRPEYAPGYQSHSGDPHLMRSDTIAGGPARPERREMGPGGPVLRRNNSNIGNSARPKNPEPISSRPIERSDLRPNTRRRLQRRWMPQAQSHTTNVRPTSESVILARQKTEKNLIKKQAENRPHSEKIPINNQKAILSVGENPTQGPQTYVTSKGGVTQASHVQATGYRGYDPNSRLKSSVQSRDIPGELTLPRKGQGNMVVGSRNNMTLMKLPPLEASLAAKKKERGLTLAQRETCV